MAILTEHFSFISAWLVKILAILNSDQHLFLSIGINNVVRVKPIYFYTFALFLILSSAPFDNLV